MKKNSIMMVCLSLLLPSCEKGDAELIFSEENISNTENITIEYYSPDPLSVAKMYWIKANGESSELVLKCKNANSILIENHEGTLSEEYISFQGHWKAEVMNSNYIVFRFEDCNNSLLNEELFYDRTGFNVVSTTSKGILRTGFYIDRFL